MSEMEHEQFHRGELAAQQRWRTADLWDTARKDRLLWDHIPGHLLARIEAAPFFFLATSAPDGQVVMQERHVRHRSICSTT